MPKPSRVPAADGQLSCSTCARVQPASAFARMKSSPDGRAYQCRECRKQYDKQYFAARPDAHWARAIRRTYGLNVEDYERLLEEQGGRCAICLGESVRKAHFAIDHDHDTGAIRGLLCYDCNLALGFFGDSPERLIAAAAYLMEHGKEMRP